MGYKCLCLLCEGSRDTVEWGKVGEGGKLCRLWGYKLKHFGDCIIIIQMRLILLSNA